jgi:hypothetical protein
MPIVGQLYRASTYPDNSFKGTLVEVTRVWNKRIIDPNCPMSVEIRTMVTYQYIEGERLGLSKTIPTSKFRRISKPVGSRNIT